MRVIFESALLIETTIISMLFVFKWYHTGVLIENTVLNKEIQ